MDCHDKWMKRDYHIHYTVILEFIDEKVIHISPNIRVWSASKWNQTAVQFVGHSTTGHENNDLDHRYAYKGRHQRQEIKKHTDVH